jgi:hypothetical protein
MHLSSDVFHLLNCPFSVYCNEMLFKWFICLAVVSVTVSVSAETVR